MPSHGGSRCGRMIGPAQRDQTCVWEATLAILPHIHTVPVLHNSSDLDAGQTPRTHDRNLLGTCSTLKPVFVCEMLDLQDAVGQASTGAKIGCDGRASRGIESGAFLPQQNISVSPAFVSRGAEFSGPAQSRPGRAMPGWHRTSECGPDQHLGESRSLVAPGEPHPCTPWYRAPVGVV